MVCSQCNREIADYSAYCSFCGTQQRAGGAARRLMRSVADCKIAGVCGGIAEYLGVDSTVVRLVWAILSVVPGGFVGGIVAYIIAWVIIPRAPIHAATSAVAPVEHAAKT